MRALAIGQNEQERLVFFHRVNAFVLFVGLKGVIA